MDARISSARTSSLTGDEPSRQALTGRVKELRFDRTAFIKAVYSGKSPELLIREILHNGYQAGATEITITLTPRGTWIIRDNGEGMHHDEIADLMDGVGASKREVGPGKNFGAGTKLTGAAFDAGLRVSSTVDGRTESTIHLAPGPNDTYGIAYLQDGSRVDRRELSRNEWLYGKTGTEVEIEIVPKDFPKTKRIVTFLSQRYGEIPVPTSVIDDRGIITPIRGTLDQIRDLVSKGLSGIVHLDAGDVFWGIRPDEAGVTASPSESVSIPTVCVSWNNEIYRRILFRDAGPAELRRWGITAGAPLIKLYAIAKGDGVTTNIPRDHIEGWSLESLRDQFAENLPPELQSFMEAYEAKNFDRGITPDEVDHFLKALKIYLPSLDIATTPGGAGRRFGPRTTQTEGNNSGLETEGGSSGSGSGRGSVPPKDNGGNGGRDKGTGGLHPNAHGTGATIKKVVNARFVPADECDGAPCVIDDRRLEVHINRDHPKVKDAIVRAKTKGGEEMEQQVKLLIQASVVYAVTDYWHQHGRMPNPDEINVIIEANFFVEAFLSGTIKLPKKART